MSKIADNRKARYNYQIEQAFEAGIVLAGWEIKSLREGRAQIAESHVVVRKGEVFLINAHISPLKTVSTHINPVPDRSRKLLLNRNEIDKLIGAVERKGYTLVPLNFHWKKNMVKVDIALAKGKKHYDKRQTEKERDWKKQVAKGVKSLH